MQKLLAALWFAAFTLASGTALAGGSDTNDVACGSVSGNWNVPNGAYLRNRGTGPIRAVMDAVGEWGTHSMLSNGPGWATHTTMHSPGTQSWPSACSTPLRPGELQYGYPGASQIDVGAAYVFYYGGTNTEDGLYFQRGDGETNNDGHVRGDTVANYEWNSTAYWWVTSQKDGNNGFWRVGDAQNSPLNYSLYQYRYMESPNQGVVPSTNHGMVCSTLQTFYAYQSGQARNGSGTGNAIDGYTYDHARVANAANALWNGVYNDCSSSQGFWDHVGTSLLCFDSDECDEVADQVVNCMSANACGTSDSSIWHGVRDNGNATAYISSPDLVTGWDDHPWGHQINGPWTWDGSNSVQWSSSGNVYGCWF